MGALVYFLLFLVVFVINTIIPKVDKKWLQRLMVIASAGILVCFIGFRFNVGTDYGAYLQRYQVVKNTSLEYATSQKTEPFVGMLYYGVSRIISNDYWIFFMYGILAIVPLYILNKKYRYKYLNYSILLYSLIFLPFSLNGARQGAAISLILLALVYLSDKNTRKAAVAFVLAVLFHRSAIIVMPHIIAYMLCKRKKWNYAKINLVLTIIVSCFILFCLNDFLIENSIDSNNYYSYISSNISANNISFSHFLHYLPMLIIAFIKSPKDKKESEAVLIGKNLIYSGLLYCIVGSSAQYLDRISLYFLAPSIIVLPMLFQNIKTNNRTVITGLILLYGLLFFVVESIILGWHEIIPYNTWFFGGNVV